MIPILGNLFASPEAGRQPRHAESADTRQEIQRHDPDQQRRRNQQGRAEEEDQFQDGSIGMISIEALQLFLESFLKRHENSESVEVDITKSETPRKPIISSPAEALRSSSRAAMAANAYRNMAQSGHKTSILGQSVAIEKAPVIKLDIKDVQIIHDVLADLKALRAGNIGYVYIKREESFLQSIVSAVEAVKGSQSFNI